ncbi:GSK3B-interacting protein [Lingula anatina]|uniref:GSK3B-interacting protein n=1 Tax=Lingula anatina TaxID=7574 RepID=A0A1S3KE07_LINAN|nr:GSK3B-interacting protein [Lingula anatina]|eukprot:XP_013420858.1 GSK3B-interacting protein [Lingula anatina]
MAGRERDSYIFEDKILKIEAEEAVKEVRYAVKHVAISTQLPCNDYTVYMNVETKEGNKLCVELSVQGFRVVGKQYDKVQEEHSSRFFETIYSLMDAYSPEYRNSFGDALLSKLNVLHSQQQAGTDQESAES